MIEPSVAQPASISPSPGDPPAHFEDVVRPHLEYLYGLAVRLCGNPTAAQDVLQTALFRAYRGFDRLRNRAQPRAWLTRILTRCHIDRFRAEHEAEEALSLDDEARFDLFDKITEEDPFPYSDRVHLDFLDLFDDEKILDVFQRLHPANRTAVILAYVYGFTAREIAEMTATTIGTVLARLFRGRKQLERNLWQYAEQQHLLRRGAPA